MQVDDSQLKLFLSDFGLVSKDDLRLALSEARKNNKKLEEVVLKKKLISKEELNKLKAYILGIPFVDLKESEINPEILKIIPEPVSRQYKAIAFDKQGIQLKVAMLLDIGDKPTLVKDTKHYLRNSTKGELFTVSHIFNCTHGQVYL